MEAIGAHCINLPPIPFFHSPSQWQWFLWIISLFFQVLWFYYICQSYSDLYTLNFIIWIASYSTYFLLQLVLFSINIAIEICLDSFTLIFHRVNIPHCILVPLQAMLRDEQSYTFPLFPCVRLLALGQGGELLGFRVMSIFHFTCKAKLSANKVVISVYSPSGVYNHFHIAHPCRQ